MYIQKSASKIPAETSMKTEDLQANFIWSFNKALNKLLFTKFFGYLVVKVNCKF